MIEIPTLRTKRLTVRLRELTIRDAIALAAIPSHLQQEAASRFLRAAVIEVSGVSDIADWTVQERTLAICHYMASTLDDGPDFSLAGGVSHYSDYLMGGVDYPSDSIELGELQGDQWSMRQLTGRLAESIERLDGELDGVSPYSHWQVGVMAAQMFPNGDDGAELTDGELDAFILARMQVMLSFPESAFVQLLSMFYRGEELLQHLLKLAVDDDGMLVMPADKTDEGDQGGTLAIPPARFLADSCITPLARRMAGKPQASST
ncbi:MAG: hypothetical protein ACRC8Q_04415 [Aeromonas sp.]